MPSYEFAPLFLIFGFASIFGGIGGTEGAIAGGLVGGFLAIISIIVCLPFAVLFLFVALKLLKLKKWARVVGIIFGVIGLIAGSGGLYPIHSIY